jgi:hypothetical protein
MTTASGVLSPSTYHTGEQWREKVGKSPIGHAPMQSDVWLELVPLFDHNRKPIAVCPTEVDHIRCGAPGNRWAKAANVNTNRSLARNSTIVTRSSRPYLCLFFATSEVFSSAVSSMRRRPREGVLDQGSDRLAATRNGSRAQHSRFKPECRGSSEVVCRVYSAGVGVRTLPPWRSRW